MSLFMACCVSRGCYGKWEKNRHCREGRGVGEYMATGKGRKRRRQQEEEEEKKKGYVIAKGDSLKENCDI